MAKKETALEVAGSNIPRALMQGTTAVGNLKDLIRENLGGSKLTLSDMNRISIPSGGGTIWQIEKPDGTIENQESLDGVIVLFKDNKAFWEKSLDDSGGGTAPDCYSTDMEHGIGDPKLSTARDEVGYLCDTCPHNQYGSAKDGTGKGKACKDVRVMFMLRGKSLLPTVIIAPPTSLKSLRKQFLNLALEEGTPYWHKFARLVLDTDKNSAGVRYSKVRAEFHDDLEGEQLEIANEYNQLIKSLTATAQPSEVLRSGEVGE